MTNTAKFAEAELGILVKSNTDPDNRPIIEGFIPEIIALAEKFGKSGQSGGSAPFVASALSQAIKKLCLQEPICDLTGIEEEWFYHEENMCQNKRCSALFRDEKGAYYLDAIIFKTQKGVGWGGSALLPDGKKIYSRQYIKGFPFSPKTFYIDVIEKEIAKDDWGFYVKDLKQLKKVFKYYQETV